MDPALSKNLEETIKEQEASAEALYQKGDDQGAAAAYEKLAQLYQRWANAAPPGHPVPVTHAIGFFTSFSFGQPCVRKRAPSATRPTSAARSGNGGSAMGRLLRSTFIGRAR